MSGSRSHLHAQIGADHLGRRFGGFFQRNVLASREFPPPLVSPRALSPRQFPRALDGLRQRDYAIREHFRIAAKNRDVERGSSGR